MRTAPVRLALLAAALAVAAAACGDDDDAAPTTIATTTTTTSTVPGPIGSASAASCAARDELQAAVAQLSDIDVVRNGTSAITDALGGIMDALAEVRSTAGDDVQPQVEAFQQSLDELQTALAAGTSDIPGIVSALRDVVSTGGTLMTSLGNLRGCS